MVRFKIGNAYLKLNASAWTYNIVNTTVQSNQNTVGSSNSSGASSDAFNKDYHPQDFTHLNENSSFKGLTSPANSLNTNIGTTG